MAQVDSIPCDLRNLRACLLCSAIKSFDQFEVDGCDNCDFILGMKANKEMVFDCTSSNFDGIIAITTSSESWCAKWLGLNKMKPGIYAISVSGRLPGAIIRELKSRNIMYKSRDRSSV